MLYFVNALERKMAFLETIVLTLIFCILFALFLVPSKRLPWNWPFVKMMPTMYFNSHKIYDKITQVLAENKGTILFKTSWFTNIDTLVTSDPSNVQYIMNSKFTMYQRGSEFRNVFDFLGDAVFNKDLDEWKEEKKLTQAFFRENQYHNSTPKIIQYTLEKGLVPILEHSSKNNQVLDLQTLFNRYMLDATCIMATGFDPASLRIELPDSPLLKAMDDIGEAVFYRHILPEKLWKLQRWLRIGKEKKLAEASKIFNEILSNYISVKRKLSSKEAIDKELGGENFDVLKFYLLEAGNEGSIERVNEALIANLMTLFFAGRDTSGALLTWFFWLISKNPLVENKIVEEIKQNLAENASPKHIFSNVQELGRLVYLHSTLCEALRLFPTGPFLLRVPIQGDILPSGHKVDQKTKIMLCSYAMGRNAEIWGEDCLEFKPERWLSDKGGIKHVASNNFLAFSSGPWTCPGKELAFIRMKAVAATTIHNFHVSILDGQNIVPSISAILTMEHGLKAEISERWN